jgi:hypothetical protein
MTQAIVSLPAGPELENQALDSGREAPERYKTHKRFEDIARETIEEHTPPKSSTPLPQPSHTKVPQPKASVKRSRDDDEYEVSSPHNSPSSTKTTSRRVSACKLKTFQNTFYNYDREPLQQKPSINQRFASMFLNGRWTSNRIPSLKLGSGDEQECIKQTL